MTFTLPELPPCINNFLFLQRINVTKNTNIIVNMIKVEKKTASKGPTCSVTWFLVLQKVDKNIFINNFVNLFFFHPIRVLLI